MPSPFVSPRARLRAPQALAFAGLTGAAMVLSPAGEVALFSGSAQDIDAGQVARIAVRALRAAKDDLVSFSYEGCRVHAAPLGLGWTLCVMSNVGVYPAAVADRLRRALRFLTVALRDGRVLGSGSRERASARSRGFLPSPTSVGAR